MWGKYTAMAYLPRINLRRDYATFAPIHVILELYSCSILKPHFILSLIVWRDRLAE